MSGRKWMIVITEEQYQWLKNVAEETHLKGSDIVRELVGRQMENNPKEFKQSLATAQLKIDLQALEEKKALIEQQEAELRKKLKSEKVLV